MGRKQLSLVKYICPVHINARTEENTAKPLITISILKVKDFEGAEALAKDAIEGEVIVLIDRHSIEGEYIHRGEGEEEENIPRS